MSGQYVQTGPSASLDIAYQRIFHMLEFRRFQPVLLPRLPRRTCCAWTLQPHLRRDGLRMEHAGQL